MKMADVEKAVAARATEIQTLTEKQDELAAQIVAEQKAAKEAAAAGDREAFGRHQTEAQALQADLDFSRTRLQALREKPAITREDAKSAWESYRSKYDPKMKAGLAHYQEIKKALMENYKALLDMQTEMIRERDKLARLAGIKDAPKETGMMFNEYLRAIFPAMTLSNKKGADFRAGIKIGGSTLIDPDAVFYMSNHAETVGMGIAGKDPFIDYMHRVVGSQTFN